jgi:type I restriction enzyme, S subunit
VSTCANTHVAKRAWGSVALADLTLKITKGTTPTTVGGRFVDHGINFLKVESIGEDGALERDKLAQIDEESHALLSRSQLEENDVLFSIAGAIGRTYLVRLDDLPANTNQALAVVRFDIGKMHPKYGYYAMRDRGFQGDALGRVVQTAQANVNLTQLAHSAINTPPLAIQQQIADILSAYDDLIENNRRRMALLEEAARQLYREWFIRLRFPGHEHTRITNGAPEGWEPKTLGDLCHEVRESVNPESFEAGTPYIGLEHMPRRSIVLGEWGTAEQVTSSKHRFREGEVLFGKIRPYFHKVGIAFLDGVASSDAIVIRPIEPKLCGFVLMTVSSDPFVAVTAQTMREGSKMPRADWKQMQQYAVPLPPDGLLSTFENAVKSIVEQLKTLALANQKLRAARDLLLPRLMSGEIGI